jgi:hypothetical protein
MKDPAFLFYDGDAARDVSHMNRLERGAYFDLIQAQRKFGGYTMEQARKILGKDFEEVWPALELILTMDENSKYFIEWVRTSMVNRMEHAEKQRKRIQDYWDKKKKEEETDIPRNNHGKSVDLPLVNENENENENELNKGIGEKNEKIDYDLIVSNYHSLCPKMAKVQVLTPKRIGYINARFGEHGLEGITKVLRLAGQSKFLNGLNDRAWKADFEWLIRPENFVKVLEGKYDNRQVLQPKESTRPEYKQITDATR